MHISKKLVIATAAGLLGAGLVATPVLARGIQGDVAGKKIEAGVHDLVQQGVTSDGQGGYAYGWGNLKNAGKSDDGKERAEANGGKNRPDAKRAAGQAFPGRHAFLPNPHELFVAVAKAIGIEPKELMKEMKEGASLKDVIENHGKTVDQVSATLADQLKARLDKAVENKKMTAEQAARIVEDVKAILPRLIDLQDVATDVRKANPPAPRQHGSANKLPKQHIAAAASIPAVAQALGLEVKDVVSELKEGKTLKQVIEGHGSTVDQVVDKMSAKLKTRLDEAVTKGKLTQAQADKVLQEFKERAKKAIESAKAPAPRAQGQEAPKPATTMAVGQA